MHLVHLRDYHCQVLILMWGREGNEITDLLKKSERPHSKAYLLNQYQLVVAFECPVRNLLWEVGIFEWLVLNQH